MDLAIGVERPQAIPMPKSNESWLNRPIIPIEQSDFSKHESPEERNVFSQVQDLVKKEPSAQKVKIQSKDQIEHLRIGSDSEPFISEQQVKMNVNADMMKALAEKLTETDKINESCQSRRKTRGEK